jgi:OOP family OmpA-OmpF porin
MKKIILSAGLVIAGFANAQDSTSLDSKSFDLYLGAQKITAPVEGTNLPQPISIGLAYREMHNKYFGHMFLLDYNMFSNLNFPKSSPKKFNHSDNFNFKYEFVANLKNLLRFNRFSPKFGTLVHFGPGTGLNFQYNRKTDWVWSFSTGLTLQYKVNEKYALFTDLSKTVNVSQNFSFYTRKLNGYSPTSYLNFNLGVNYYAFGDQKGREHSDWSSSQDETAAKLAELRSKLATAESKLVDSDNDGVVDFLDAEQGTPAGSFVNTKGQRIVDMDGDGIVDSEDYCPTVKGSLEFKGCPTGMTSSSSNATSSNGEEVIGDEIKGELKFKVAKISKDVNFDSKSTSIKSSFKPELDALAKTLNENSNLVVALHGHCDNVGEDNLNDQLSIQRAQSVKDYLVSKGVNSSIITTKGHGTSMPKVSNDTERGRATNRRVEFVVKSK